VKGDFLIISCSLSPASRSRALALALHERLLTRVQAEYIDARRLPLPFCDAAEAYGHPLVAPLQARIAAARCVILAVPIYNYSTSGFAKNLIELTGEAWNDKIVGFLCAAGGHRSYMSAMPLANSLMLDFECVIIPRYVYGSGADFAGDEINAEVRTRIENLAATAIRLTEAL